MIDKVSNLRLRPTQESDLEFVLAAEQDENNSPYVGQWSRQQHLDTFSNPAFFHLVAENTAENRQIGYVILQDINSPDLSLQLRRIVITEKSKGYGTEVLRQVKRLAFKQLSVHRLWLDVMSNNTRARRVYQAQGFVEEGILRECLKFGDRFESLVIMSILRQEYNA
ncbi:MAG: GNAT family N-acetyltransferase [Chloroflexi bacterium]|uniref:GNAT family N-acetyltransferase n=1 Tax=Candidatus Chlorohelix allophototropha TaxID=3003348 RepID=A0A8T7M9B4_9CHLR|nr:GNAT family N-acetyltransferase [Chloroflexota bacterium]WJW68523.1 GNAT family N-acetyltransferase [Chloroflexota bacterium L227-S17]